MTSHRCPMAAAIHGGYNKLRTHNPPRVRATDCGLSDLPIVEVSRQPVARSPGRAICASRTDSFAIIMSGDAAGGIDQDSPPRSRQGHKRSSAWTRCALLDRERGGLRQIRPPDRYY